MRLPPSPASSKCTWRSRADASRTPSRPAISSPTGRPSRASSPRCAGRRPRAGGGARPSFSLAGEPPAPTLPVLLETLGADGGDLRWAAADIVVRLRDRAGLVGSLRGLVTSGNAGQRKMALYCLRDIDA